MAKFEDQLKGLEGIVERLEKGELPLEESIKLFEEGVKLSDACKQELEAAESRVEVLLKQKNGTMKAEPFTEPEEE